jgi:predicted amidophosphoribosyltransferase
MMYWQRCVTDPPRTAPEPGAVEPPPAGSRRDVYGLLAPRRGQGVCGICFNLIRPECEQCRACRAGENHLDVVTPISYSVGGSELHREIAAYKRYAEPFVRYAVQDLAMILEHFLSIHELCVGAGEPFHVVTTVPSSDRRRDQHHQLRRLVGELVPSVSSRYQRLLVTSDLAGQTRSFDRGRYQAVQSLPGQRVLLIDDMWTTGASAQSAAAALRGAGASYVAAVAIGRHLNRDYADNRTRIAGLEGRFSWTSCGLCAPVLSAPGAH